MILFKTIMSRALSILNLILPHPSDGSMIQIKLEGNPIEGFTDEDYDLLKEFISSDRVMFGSEYHFAGYDEEGKRFIFNQLVDDIPIADGTSEISLYVNETGEV